MIKKIIKTKQTSVKESGSPQKVDIFVDVRFYLPTIIFHELIWWVFSFEFVISKLRKITQLAKITLNLFALFTFKFFAQIKVNMFF